MTDWGRNGGHAAPGPRRRNCACRPSPERSFFGMTHAHRRRSEFFRPLASHPEMPLWLRFFQGPSTSRWLRLGNRPVREGKISGRGWLRFGNWRRFSARIGFVLGNWPHSQTDEIGWARLASFWKLATILGSRWLRLGKTNRVTNQAQRMAANIAYSTQITWTARILGNCQAFPFSRLVADGLSDSECPQ